MGEVGQVIGDVDALPRTDACIYRNVSTSKDEQVGVQSEAGVKWQKKWATTNQQEKKQAEKK